MLRKVIIVGPAVCLGMAATWFVAGSPPMALAGSAETAQKPAAPSQAASSPATPAAAATPAATAVPQKGVPVPDNAKITLMIQLHVAALSLANLTGNYSVLHALGTPSFQTANTLSGLADRFAAFRRNGIDISPALVYPPVLVGTPVMEANNVMRVSGFYATEPQRIAFDLAFQPANNMWRLADIQVRTLMPEPPPAPVADAKPAPAAKPKTAAAADAKTAPVADAKTALAADAKTKGTKPAALAKK